MLTYSIKFPSIFGDDKVHEIVTYWGDDPIVSSANEEASLMPECTKAIFNGKVLAINKVAQYSTSREGNYYIYCIDIVLDKKPVTPFHIQERNRPDAHPPQLQLACDVLNYAMEANGFTHVVIEGILAGEKAG